MSLKPMRLKKKERDAEFALGVFQDCEYATLATLNPDGTPYCVPVSPVVIDGALYFHGALEGQKAENIASHSAVCMSAVRAAKSVPEWYTISYESAVACGNCSVVSEREAKIAVLRAMVEKYAKSNMSAFDNHIAQDFAAVCIYRIDIEQITGKAA